ncbi:MAG: TIGR03936 family radical SAM-associated protein [Thermoguttaceae bacterium]
MVRQRARIRFGKQGDLRLIGHRDLMRAIQRMFRRAGLRVAMSQGFHPKPRMSFPSALGVGVVGLDEVLEVELAEPYTAEELQQRLAPHLVAGLSLGPIEILPPGARKARLRSTTWQIAVPPQRQAQTAARLEQLKADQASSPNQSDWRRSVEELTLQGGVVRFRLRAGPQQGARPRQVLEALGLEDLERMGVPLTRTKVELEP